MFIVFLALTKTRQADQFVTRNSSLDLRTLSFIFYSNLTSEIIFFYAFVLFNQGLAHFDFSFFICFIYNFTSFLFIYFMWLTFFFVFRLILCVFVSDDYIFIGFWCPGQSGKPLSESVRGASWRLRSIIFISLLFCFFILFLGTLPSFYLTFLYLLFCTVLHFPFCFSFLHI